MKGQQDLQKQYSNVTYLLYFLIALNLIQILFQSNLYTHFIEPAVEKILLNGKE
jgi:hypothetical protein